jgi:hypothetical protein
LHRRAARRVRDRVRVLDAAAASSRDAIDAPTAIGAPAAMTAIGLVLETPTYMSPEQAAGRTADRRGDIWAFGCVLYEMLTGRRAFTGDDVPSVVAAVMTATPDFSAVPADTPATLRRLVRQCLQKDPRAPRVSRLNVAPEEAAAFTVGVSRDVAITPDGARLVYVGANATTLFVRPLDQIEPAPIVRGSGLRDPFVSPDGQWVGFFDGGLTLTKAPITGGPAILIARLDSFERGAV